MVDVVSRGVHITELIRHAITPLMLGYGLFAICFTSTPQRIECQRQACLSVRRMTFSLHFAERCVSAVP